MLRDSASGACATHLDEINRMTSAAPLSRIASLAVGGSALASCLADIRRSYHVAMDESARRIGLIAEGVLQNGRLNAGAASFAHLGTLAPLYPEWLGDRRFAEIHGCRFPYIAGEMARGVASVAMVVAAGRAGFLGFFGAAGIAPARVAEAVREIGQKSEGRPWGSNLIHSPNEPELERAMVDVYLGENVRRVSASAFMALTPQVVRYACRGLHTDPSGQIKRTNHVFAKISRTEVAAQFMAPPPRAMLDALVAAGDLTRSEADLAQHLPVAEDVTAESDSGGHTDNRPLTVLLPLILRERDRAMSAHRFARQIRVGAAGGLGTPSSVAAAFALGTSYVLTGTVNQAAIESGLPENGRRMLADAGMADVTMAPCADMFEMGVKVQVLRKGTFFAQRATKLYELYRNYTSLDAIPDDARKMLERDLFRRPLGEIEAEVNAFFKSRNPSELERAAQDPQHRMALIFRWYLGHSSRWPIAGDEQRRLDYQIWCGPAIGAFNDWTRDSFLGDPAQRTVAQIGLNLLEGAAIASRAQQARCHGIDVPAASFEPRPRPMA